MNTIILAFEGFKAFLEQVTCDDLSKCYLYYGLALNVFSVLILAIVDFSKTRIVKVVVGDVWCLILVAVSVYIIFSHTCLYTAVTTLISFILLILISLAVADDKNIKKKEEEEKPDESTYVIKSREGGTYSFFLYVDKNVEIESKYTYTTIDDAVKAINIIKNYVGNADKEKKLGSWNKYTTYPRFEIIQSDKFYNYKLSINEKYTVLVSKKFKKYEECCEVMNEIEETLKNSEVYISNEKPRCYESAVLDPYFDDIPLFVQKELKETPVIIQQIPVEVKPEVNKEEVKAIETKEEIKEETTPTIEETKETQIPTPKITLKNNDDDDDDKEEKEIVIVDGKEMYVTYRKSIFAKLTLARPETKANYVDLANYIGKYDVRRRDSWEFISYFKGKDTILKLGVKGRTLFIYYGLPYEEYKETGYFLKEAKAKAHEKTPTVLRVKSDRALKHAKELVDELMKRNELVRDETRENPESIEKYNEKTLDDLLKDGYIKYLFTEIPKEEQNK